MLGISSKWKNPKRFMILDPKEAGGGGVVNPPPRKKVDVWGGAGGFGGPHGKTLWAMFLLDKIRILQGIKPPNTNWGMGHMVHT